MSVVLVELQYLPSVAYFSLINEAEDLLLEANENFEKQTYRNRCEILSSQKRESLTIPLIGANKKIQSREIKIDNEQNWQKKHWRTLKTCYGKTPFYEFFADEFEPFYYKKYNYLWDFNLDILTRCLKIIRLPKNIVETVSYEKKIIGKVIDARSLITPKNRELVDKNFNTLGYHQNFGNTFEKNLSIIDLLMNEGPNTRGIIDQSKFTKHFD
jgi:hypothetical protein